MHPVSSDDQSLVRLSVVSIGVAVAVLLLKILAYRMTGSVALYSDALESTINVITALIAWYAVRISQRPADLDHPFGHHKAEYFSAVISGVLIVLAAILILREAVNSLFAARVPSLDAASLAVALVATLLNLLWARYLISCGERLRSPAVTADGRHIMSDVWTSAGALAGLLLVLLTGWFVLDAVMAMLVALNILREGWRVIRSSVDGLMDRAIDETGEARIRDAIITHATGAIEVHDIKTRSAGRIDFAEFHLVVDGAMTVSDSHDICDRIEAALRQTLPGVQVTIHVEPQEKEKADSLRIEQVDGPSPPD